MEENGLLPRKTDGYRYAESVFYEQFVDISFYVEDEDQEELYSVIIRKILPEIKEFRVFPLNGKKNVLEHCELNSDRKKHIYIVDKDFDDLHNRKLDILNLIYLNDYCIENYFLEETAVINFIVSEKPKLKKSDVAKEIKIKSLVRDMARTLSPLFKYYYIAQKYNVTTIRNSGISPFCYIDHGSNTCINTNKISDYKSQLMKELVRQGVSANVVFTDLIAKTEFNANRTNHLIKHISGKYLLIYTLFTIKKMFGLRKADIGSACYRMAEYCEFQSLEYLAKKVHVAFES